MFLMLLIKEENTTRLLSQGHPLNCILNEKKKFTKIFLNKTKIYQTSRICAANNRKKKKKGTPNSKKKLTKFLLGARQNWSLKKKGMNFVPR
jgi:hypothetical protein